MLDLKYAYQLQLQWIGQDETTGYGFFATIENEYQRWQVALDFIIRGVQVGLIEDLYDYFPGGIEQLAKCMSIEPIDFALGTTQNPVKTYYWIEIQFYPTDLLQQVLKQHNLDCWTSPPNPEFIAWLENRFAEYGVPFSDEPLVLIQPPQSKFV